MTLLNHHPLNSIDKLIKPRVAYYLKYARHRPVAPALVRVMPSPPRYHRRLNALLSQYAVETPEHVSLKIGIAEPLPSRDLVTVFHLHGDRSIRIQGHTLQLV